jgi:hypothetical protein
MKNLETQFENLGALEIEKQGFKITKINDTKLSIIYHVILPNGEEGKISLDKPKFRLYNASYKSCVEYQNLLD